MKAQLYLILFAVVGKIAQIQSAENVPNTFRLAYEKSGNVTLVGVFEALSDNECFFQSPKSLEEITSAIWTVETLNKCEYLPGTTIGLTVYEWCPKTLEMNEEVFAENLSNLMGSDSAGLMTTIEKNGIQRALSKEGMSGRVAQVRHIIDEVALVGMVVQVLVNLQWMVVRTVAADTDDVLNLFWEKSRSEGVYTYNEVLIGESSADSIKNSTETDEPEVIVVIAKYEATSLFLEMGKQFGKSIKLILAPTDFVFRPLKDLPKNTLVLLPAVGNEVILRKFVTGNESHKDFLRHSEPTKSPLFIGVATAILKLLSPLKEMDEKPCLPPGEGLSNVTSTTSPHLEKSNKDYSAEPVKLISDPVSSDDVTKALAILNLNGMGEMFLYLGQSPNDSPNSEDVAIFQLYNLKTKTLNPVLLKVKPRLFDEVESVSEGSISEDGIKRFSGSKTTFSSSSRMFSDVENWNEYALLADDQNATFRVNYEYRFREKNESYPSNVSESFPGAVWRSETWVLVNTCLGFTGLLSILFVMSFMVHRICRGDPLEGSPIFIIVLMIAVSFVFVSSLCYHFDPLPETAAFLCTCRALAPSFVYSVLFSLMFSRSVMLAFSENQNAFISHVNGYFQSVLFLSLLGIQVSMTSQTWTYEKVLIYSPSCSEVHSGRKLISSLIYDCVLLILLTAVTPFIIRLQRNYREGLLLGVSSFFVAAVWSGWMSGYHFLTPDLNDAFVAMGMNATGWTLLIFAFVPRVYMMILAAIRNRNAASLSLDSREPLPKVSDVRYKPNDLPLDGDLCETFNVGVLNPNFIQ